VIAEGETAREAGRRVFEEATGVALERLRVFRDTQANSGEETLLFADDDVPEEGIAGREGVEWRYWRPEEVAGLPMADEERALLGRFLASDLYRGTLATKAPDKVGVAVLEIDRWGRVLLQLRDADLPRDRWPDAWSLPGGLLEPGESPDAAALREFEEETGWILEELKLYRVFRKGSDLPGLLVNTEHVYYVDADIDEDLIEVGEGQAFRYFAPGEIAGLRMPPHAREILRLFFESSAYRGMFH
jgi:8-oxo-dGTP diphosphatase